MKMLCYVIHKFKKTCRELLNNNSKNVIFVGGIFFKAGVLCVAVAEVAYIKSYSVMFWLSVIILFK
jgi:hypothetical protein